MFSFDDAVKITSELHDPNTQKSHLRNKKREYLTESTDRRPSKRQIKTILTTLEC